MVYFRVWPLKMKDAKKAFVHMFDAIYYLNLPGMVNFPDDIVRNFVQNYFLKLLAKTITVGDGINYFLLAFRACSIGER